VPAALTLNTRPEFSCYGATRYFHWPIAGDAPDQWRKTIGILNRL
jgi:hypothetical protein